MFNVTYVYECTYIRMYHIFQFSLARIKMFNVTHIIWGMKYLRPQKDSK